MANAFFVEPYDLPTVFAEGSAAGTVPANLNNDWIGVVHRGTSTSAAGVFVDLAAARDVDVAALLSSSVTGADLEIFAGNASMGAGTSVAAGPFPAGTVMPVSGRSNSLVVLPSPVSARYWTVHVDNAGAVFEAGRLVLGKKMQFASNFNFGAAFGVRDLGGGEFSQQGVWLPKAGAKLRTLGISFSRATKAEAEAQLTPLLERVGNGRFVLVVTDPEPSDQRQRRMYFGPLTGNLDAIWNTSNGFEWRANLTSVI